MKRLTLLVLILVVISFSVVFASLQRNRSDKKKWELIWKDDFSENYLDSMVWGYMKRGRDASRKYHSSNPLCYGFRDGKLILKGIINPDTSKDTATYLTGAITTKNKKAFAPGKIEIRAKINSARGAWPAFWLLPFKNDKGWPADGEIDIMEHLNYDEFVYQTVHSGYTKADPNAIPQRFVRAKVDVGKFNTYGVSIEEDEVVFYVNGMPTLTYPRLDSPTDSLQFPFYRDWYLMLDMQLGGSWVGKIDPKDLPVEMEIDWVKYYVRK